MNPVCLQVTAITKEGKPLVVEILLNEVIDPEGQKLFVVVFHDITRKNNDGAVIVVNPTMIMMVE